jgi:hypothetical protein
MKFGHLLHYDHLTKIADIAGIEVVQKFCDMIDDPAEFYKGVKSREGIEGFVTVFPLSGRMIKVKTDSYHKMSYTFNNFKSDRMCWMLVFEERLDDIMSQSRLPAGAEWIVDFNEQVLRGLYNFCSKIGSHAEELKNEHPQRPDFAAALRRLLSREDSWKMCFYFAYFDGYILENFVKEFCKNKVRNNNLLQKITGVSVADFRGTD